MFRLLLNPNQKGAPGDPADYRFFKMEGDAPTLALHNNIFMGNYDVDVLGFSSARDGRSRLASSSNNIFIWQGEAELLEEVLDERIKVGDHPEVYFDFDPSKFAHGDWREHIPPGYAIETIDGCLVDKLTEHYAVFKTWRPASSFDANAFGYCLMYGDEIASIGFAYSSITVEGYVELGARTAEKHRRRGLATLVCSAFIDQCLRDDLIPDWHTNSSNSGSIALAEGLGYELAGDFEAYYYSCQ